MDGRFYYIAVAIVLTIPEPFQYRYLKHLILNGLWIQLFGIQSPHCVLLTLLSVSQLLRELGVPTNKIEVHKFLKFWSLAQLLTKDI